MSLHDDFADSLANEVLTEMADNFFGSRKHLEGSINIFHKYVKALKEKEQDINNSLSLLNFMLTGPEILRDFLKAVDLNPEIFIIQEKIPKHVPVYIPFALTQKGVFTKLVSEAYSSFQSACDSYISGKRPDYMQDKKLEQMNAYYNLIYEMCTLINDDIKKHNANISPTMVLQRFKRFDPVTSQKQSITGGSTFNGDDSNLSSNLAFEPVELEKLHIKNYPLPRPYNKVSGSINTFCKKIYHVKEKEIKTMISQLKNKFNHFSSP